MTVTELIALLEKHPADTEVLVQSYEEGYDPVTDVKPISVSKKPEKSWCVGFYEENPQSGKPILSIQSRQNRAEKDDP